MLVDRLLLAIMCFLLHIGKLVNSYKIYDLRSPNWPALAILKLVTNRKTLQGSVRPLSLHCTPNVWCDICLFLGCCCIWYMCSEIVVFSFPKVVHKNVDSKYN